MRAVRKKAWADIRRRRLQSLIVASVALLASAVMTLATSLLTGASSPFDAAFEAQRGGHVMLTFDSRFVTADQVLGTAQRSMVTAHGGPWTYATLPFEVGTGKVQLRVLARDDPGGVDSLRVVQGRWPRGPGEIAITRSLADVLGVRAGDHVRDVGGAQGVSLQVVGLAIDVDTGPYPNFMLQPAWVVPAQLDAIAGTGAADRGYLMAYRLRNARTQADLSQGVAALSSGLPDGAVTASLSYLLVKQLVNLTGSLVLTFLVAFGVMALAAAALVVANVVAGAVLAGYREIGITRALGFSPGQSVLGIMLTVLLPALLGAVAGMPLGLLLSAPLLEQSAQALGLPPASPSPLTAVAGLLVLLAVAIGALTPAVRAGRLSPVRAIVVGSSPPGSRRSTLVRLLRWARLPRWLSLGAGDAYARPVRGLLTTAAVTVGVATSTFAVGFGTGLERYVNDLGLFTGRGDVLIQRLGDYPDSALMGALDARPDTRLVVSSRFDFLSVSGLSDPVQVQSWRGDSGQLGLHLLAGRWFNGPGEVVVGPGFLSESRLQIGDSFDASLAGRHSRLRIVGSYFTTQSLGRTIGMDWSTLEGFDPSLEPQLYQVILEPGSDVSAYIRQVGAPSQLQAVDLKQTIAEQLAPTRNSLDAVLVVLVVVLTLIAAAGVFNTVLLTTRERVRDTAVLRTLGMGPGRTLTMVSATAAVIGIVGGVLGTAAGLLAYRGVIGLAAAAIGNPLSESAAGIYGPGSLLALVAAGVVVAVAAALLPARWAASSAVAAVLRAE